MKTSKKIIQFPLESNKVTDVVMTKKKMKNIRLSVSNAGKISVSLPYHTTYAYAYQFLMRKRDWINTQLDKINTNIKKDTCNFVHHGKIFILGQNFDLSIVEASSNMVIFDSGFTIYTKKLDIEYVKQTFVKWCKNYFLDFFFNRLKFIYNQMFKDNNYPAIKIKHMKSMWGNCNFVKRTISFNLYLSKASLECIDYVITHELAHLIHPNHSKEFHNLMTTLMPDWKIRKNLLKNYSLTF